MINWRHDRPAGRTGARPGRRWRGLNVRLPRQVTVLTVSRTSAATSTDNAGMSDERHSRLVDGRRHYYRAERLWALAAGLPVTDVPIDDIAEFDQDCWFDGIGPTCRQVADHARRIESTDLAYPVILSASGALMDGGHRIAKAWLLGRSSVQAVRFPVDPEPDWIVDDNLHDTR